MKATGLTLTAALLWLAMTGNAFAAGSTKVYNSGILVLAFIAVCALVVVVQLIPAIMTLVAMIKGSSNKSIIEADAKK